MIKLTNPLNKDGILYEKGAILVLPIEQEKSLIANTVAEDYSETVEVSSLKDKDTKEGLDAAKKVKKNSKKD